MNSKKNLKRNLLICLLAGSAVMYTLPLHAATSVIGNNTLPTGGSFVHGNGSITSAGLEMNVIQNGQNAVIKWGSFDVGGSATVNFSSKGAYANNFNTLNYVNSASASQIYGTINAQGGNIFIVNPAGVQIGNSAQINVGSLYVSNNEMNDDNFNHFMNNADPNNIINYALQGKSTEAALMSLGNINANHVTFEGDGRIVIDSERLKDVAGTEKLTADKIFVNTKDKNNVVIGYDAYENGSYANVINTQELVTLNGSEKLTKADGYMWVEDVNQLQDINTNLSGNYALRNSIDATSTEQKGFTSIGSDNDAFKGKFDGIDYNIFGLTINGGDNTGLFGYTNNATISNVTLVGGSITGSNNVGAIVGNANNTTLTNVVNSAAVSGVSNVGGIVGRADDSAIKDAINTGTINGSDYNVGGLIGNLQNSKLDTTKEVEKGLIGNSYNLGDVSGNGHNVGGLVGSASNSTIGDGTNLVYNRMDVTGAYNVGGIVGNMAGSTVQNAENSGNVTATGYDNGKYTFHTDYDQDGYSKDGIKTVDVNVANVGGIAGTASANSTITDVLNTADVSSKQQNNNDYYDAGNVGGIVGSAVDTNISNATNKENEVRGAHNVGGVAGYFSGAGRITGGINDGGDIMATGARYTNNGTTAIVTETIRKDYDGSNNDGKYVIGNIGGIVGYMEGDNVHIDASGNRGTVHTLDISDGNNISDASEVANVGGIVGKIDRSSKITDKNELGENYVNAAVSNSYNTGDVRGFTAIGGIAGMMYNGGIAGAYNLGEIRSTRVATGNETPLNMGGIVGDTTEVSNARAFIYDVYNKGKIGDEAFKYKGRHVGGIVGRLSGVVEKAYNTGAIYNGAAVTGGIAGYLSAGKIENVFNTGNITVENNDGENLGTQLGGLVGAANIGRGNVNISNAYNLGVIRSFNGDKTQHNVGGIVGYLVNYTSGIQGENAGNLTIKNVYTTGDLYSEGGETTVGALYGGRRENVTNPIIQNAVYITPSNNAFTEVAYGNLQDATEVTGIYGSSDAATNVWNNFIKQSNVNNEGQTLDLWRVYDGTTPILNAFMPNSKDYFGNEGDYSAGSENSINTGIDKIQYGTAYNPLLTIINANKDLVYDWEELGINNDAGLAVYGYGVTLNNFRATGGTGYFGGTIYADGALNLKGSSDIGLGSASQIYGSDVTIGTNGKVTIYGNVTATGNEKDNNDTTGSITINAGEVDVYGTLTSAKKDQQIQISGIAGSVNPGFNFENITDKTKPVTNVGDSFAHEVTASETGNITINAGQNGTGSGNVNLYYGNKEEGLITTGGNLTVTGEGDVYVDSDLAIGGDLTLEAGAGNEALLDITNIGQVQNNHDNEKAKETLHNFLDHFATNKISFGETQDAKITVDMWNGNNLDLEKFDDGNTTLVSKLNSLNVDSAGDKTAKELTHIWVNNGEQLKNIQNAVDKALGYNFALKGDINASDVTDYEAIGTNSANGFTGTFDGRGNRIIGLKVDNNNGNAGIFSTIGASGTVKNVNIYSGNFTGGTSAGAVAGMNSGRIENVTGFGNTVEVSGAGSAGGIVGVNTSGSFDGNGGALTGGIYDVQNIGSVITESGVAGGLVGTNDGALGNSYSDSAVTSTAGTSNGLGGVAGVNKGDVQFVDSLGVTNGGTNSDNVGGIIGVNNGNMYSGYNESIVSGSSNVGGIIGTNAGSYNETDKKWTSGTVENVVNATSVTSEATDSKNTGGLVGTNTGSVTNGRNNGTITGTNYVGGLVGDNADEHSILTNLVNDSSAEILGEQYVGGIAGSNSGTITADEDNDNLVNRGTITGNKYVGGVAGENKDGGTIANTLNSVVLHATGNNAQYFGGVVGSNSGVIDGATNTSDINITAEGGSYVGGIIGHNTDLGTLKGEILNEGSVSGKLNVGGIIGQNDNDYVLQGTADERLVVKNKGNAVAEDGGAAGIFYKNTGDILYADISNDGVVDGGTGTDGTGGLFGINTGAISNSTLTNSGEVKGAGNVGGLIGVNSGNVTNSSLTNTGSVTGTNNVGGLIGKNIGTITGGRDEKNSYYKYQIYNNGTITANSNGSNIGGLFGTNNGTVKAAYNTGVINAGQSSNVGGIAGANSGTLDQVFNTVMTETGTSAITGDTNVGGLVGTNSGTLSNAYNTTEVKSTNNGVVGNAVGNNTTGTITNIYASNTSGNLIGAGYNNGKITNAYSFATGDTTATKVLTDESAQKAEGNYEFNNKNDGTTWKFYDGYSNPLLKVFLTTLTVDSNKVDLVYNAGEQDLNIGQLVQDGIISAPVVKDDKDNIIYDGMDAYHNTVIKDETNKLGNSELLQNTTGQKDAGTYDNWLYSGQIASGSKDGSGFNPNNLGYDIVYTKNDSGETGVEIGKATINIDLGKVEHTYGNADVINGTGDFKNEAGYGFGFNITNSNLTQEMKDELNDKGLGFVFEKDNALTGDTSGRVTEDVKDGGYTWSANFKLSEELKKNYQFDDNGSATLNKADGQSIVNQAKLEISVDDAETMPGVMPNFTGTNIQQGLVNGDVVGNYDYALDSSVDINVDDVYTDKIGISFGNSETYYDLDNVDWSTIPGWEFLKNYDINFDPGTLTVDSEIMPEIPDNWPNNRWDYLFGDNPFDRNENFRERKAEVNFVDGAMEI